MTGKPKDKKISEKKVYARGDSADGMFFVKSTFVDLQNKYQNFGHERSNIKELLIENGLNKRELEQRALN